MNPVNSVVRVTFSRDHLPDDLFRANVLESITFDARVRLKSSDVSDVSATDFADEIAISLRFSSK